jgi:hypothetical protein
MAHDMESFDVGTAAVRLNYLLASHSITIREPRWNLCSNQSQKILFN